jgi:hypothetical protein
MFMNECLNCRHYCKPTNLCTNPTFKAKWNEKSICAGYDEIRRKYYYFTYQDDANEFAKRKNKLARIYKWIVRSNVDGYTCYCLKGVSND